MRKVLLALVLAVLALAAPASGENYVEGRGNPNQQHECRWLDLYKDLDNGSLYICRKPGSDLTAVWELLVGGSSGGCGGLPNCSSVTDLDGDDNLADDFQRVINELLYANIGTTDATMSATCGLGSNPAAYCSLSQVGTVGKGVVPSSVTCTDGGGQTAVDNGAGVFTGNVLVDTPITGDAGPSNNRCVGSVTCGPFGGGAWAPLQGPVRDTPDTVCTWDDAGGSRSMTIVDASTVTGDATITGTFSFIEGQPGVFITFTNGAPTTPVTCAYTKGADSTVNYVLGSGTLVWASDPGGTASCTDTIKNDPITSSTVVRLAPPSPGVYDWKPPFPRYCDDDDGASGYAVPTCNDGQDGGFPELELLDGWDAVRLDVKDVDTLPDGSGAAAEYHAFHIGDAWNDFGVSAGTHSYIPVRMNSPLRFRLSEAIPGDRDLVGLFADGVKGTANLEAWVGTGVSNAGFLPLAVIGKGLEIRGSVDVREGVAFTNGDAALLMGQTIRVVGELDGKVNIGMHALVAASFPFNDATKFTECELPSGGDLQCKRFSFYGPLGKIVTSSLYGPVHVFGPMGYGVADQDGDFEVTIEDDGATYVDANVVLAGPMRCRPYCVRLHRNNSAINIGSIDLDVRVRGTIGTEGATIVFADDEQQYNLDGARVVLDSEWPAGLELNENQAIGGTDKHTGYATAAWADNIQISVGPGVAVTPPQCLNLDGTMGACGSTGFVVDRAYYLGRVRMWQDTTLPTTRACRIDFLKNGSAIQTDASPTPGNLRIQYGDIDLFDVTGNSLRTAGDYFRYFVNEEVAEGDRFEIRFSAPDSQWCQAGSGCGCTGLDDLRIAVEAISRDGASLPPL